MEATDSAITVFSNMQLVAGVYFKAWLYVSDSCSVCRHPDHSSPTLIVVYLHVEACPLRCKDILRHRGGWKLVWLDLMGLHPEGRTLCHVRRRTTQKVKWYVNCISKAYAMFSRSCTDVDSLFGSLKTRGLFLARSSASFSLCALSGRSQKNSLNAK